MKFHDVKENEWIWPKMGGYLLKCCDCGLVHDIAFVAQGKKIGVAARRNNRATAARRRPKNKAGRK